MGDGRANRGWVHVSIIIITPLFIFQQESGHHRHSLSAALVERFKEFSLAAFSYTLVWLRAQHPSLRQNRLARRPRKVNQRGIAAKRGRDRRESRRIVGLPDREVLNRVDGLAAPCSLYFWATHAKRMTICILCPSLIGRLRQSTIEAIQK